MNASAKLLKKEPVEDSAGIAFHFLLLRKRKHNQS